MSDREIKELDALLEGERSAILDGSYARLPSFVDRKESLIAAIAKRPQSSNLAPIARKIFRNQELIGAAIEGMRAATGQISSIRGVVNGFQIYDHLGDRQRVGGNNSIIERKL